MATDTSTNSTSSSTATTTTAATTTSPTTTPPTKPKKEEETTIARKVNAWGFTILLGLVFLVFGPVASILSWRSNTLEGTHGALKVLFALLAYFGNFLYILWFAFKKTIIPAAKQFTDDTVSSIASPFSDPTPAAPVTRAPMLDELDEAPAPLAPSNVVPAPTPAPVAPQQAQQGGKKKAKPRRR